MAKPGLNFSASQKPAGTGWQGFAEFQIRQAMNEGQFANLPGAGKPIAGLDEPYDEDWWLTAFLKREKLSIPCPSLDIRREVESCFERISHLSIEADVRKELNAINLRIATVNQTTTSGPATSVATVDVEKILTHWRATPRNRRCK